jgi:hypothetical protein
MTELQQYSVGEYEYFYWGENAVTSMFVDAFTDYYSWYPQAQNLLGLESFYSQ